MAQLTTVSDYVDKARELLQDTVDAPYRFASTDIIDALNSGLLEARRLRPDMFISTSFVVPSYSGVDDVVVWDQQYRMTLVYYIVGHMNLRDEEENQDQRAVAFLNKFIAQLSATGA